MVLNSTMASVPFSAVSEFDTASAPAGCTYRVFKNVDTRLRVLALCSGVCLVNLLSTFEPRLQCQCLRMLLFAHSFPPLSANVCMRKDVVDPFPRAHFLNVTEIMNASCVL